MKKKLLCFMLIAAMAVVSVFTFAACGGGKNHNTVTVTVAGGVLSNGKTTATYRRGTNVTVTAVHPLGNEEDPFVKWTRGRNESSVLSTSESYTFEANENITIVSWWADYGAAPIVFGNTSLVIYAENNGQPGTYDKDVELAIETKFYQDTGVPLDIHVEMVSTGLLGNKVAGDLSAGRQVDAMNNHWGADSPIDAYLKSHANPAPVHDLSSMLGSASIFKEEYYAADPDGLAYYSGYYNGNLRGISGVSRSSMWGILVNASYMANTSFNPAEYDAANPDCKSLTVSEFKQLIQELKERNRGSLLDQGRVINAAPWALDYVLAPALGGTTYGGFAIDSNGNVVPSWSTEGYKNVLEFDRWLQENSYWIENPAGSTSSNNDFFGGKNAILLSWPDATNNIAFARQLKSTMNHESIVLAPIVPDGSPEGTKGANARMQAGFSGFVMPSSSTQTELMAMYLDWLYTKSESGEYENYELAKYGVKGTHWIAGSKAYNNQTINTWDYPAANKEQFKTVKPYSGKFLFLDLYTIDDRVWADYTDQELGWWFAQQNFDSSPTQYALEGVNITSFGVNDRELTALDAEMGKAYTSMRTYAWASTPIEGGKTISQLHEALVAEMYDKYMPLINYYTRYYNWFQSQKPARV